MNPTAIRSFGSVPTVLLLSAGVLMSTGAVRAASSSLSASDAVHAAVVARLGAGVEVAVTATGVHGGAQIFREARPDPAARLGGPMRFLLVTDQGAVVPVTVTMDVVGERVVARRAIARGETLTPDDVEAVHGAIVDVPLRRLPTRLEMLGARVLRPLPAGSTLLSAFVAARRLIERGDVVTVVAAAGAIEVTATMVAADGGRVGEVIRVVNPDSKRYLRARIVKKGFVEVIDGR